MWQARPITDDAEFKYLRSGCDPSMEMTENVNLDTCSSSVAGGSSSSGSAGLDMQHLAININNLSVTVESGRGTNTVPLLLLESSVNLDVRDFMGPRLNGLGSVDLEVAYYNAKVVVLPFVRRSSTPWYYKAEFNHSKNSSHRNYIVVHIRNSFFNYADFPPKVLSEMN